jgi:hypothetical protein
MIHVFGDSHAMIFQNFKNLPISVKWHSTTMYSLTNLDKFVEESNIDKGDVIIFIYGEIDVRYRIGQQMENKSVIKTLDSVVENTVTKYIYKIREICNKKLCMPIVYLPVPPYPRWFGKNKGNAEFPTTGTIPERMTYHNKLCQILIKKCQENTIPILDVLDIISLPSGEFNTAFADKFETHIDAQFWPIVQNRLLQLLCKLNIALVRKEDVTTLIKVFDSFVN